MTPSRASHAQNQAVPYTVAMERRLELLAETGARIVGVKDGLPVVRAPSGRRMVLTTLGRLERI